MLRMYPYADDIDRWRTEAGSCGRNREGPAVGDGIDRTDRSRSKRRFCRFCQWVTQGRDPRQEARGTVRVQSMRRPTALRRS
jgi:hypothetical protein